MKTWLSSTRTRTWYVLKESSTDNVPRTVHQRWRLDCQVRVQGLDMSLRSRPLTMCRGLFTRDEDLTVKYEDKDLIYVLKESPETKTWLSSTRTRTRTWYVLKESSTDNVPRTVHQRQRLDCQVWGQGQGLDMFLRSRPLTMFRGLFTRDKDLTVKYEDKDLICS